MDREGEAGDDTLPGVITEDVHLDRVLHKDPEAAAGFSLATKFTLLLLHRTDSVNRMLIFTSDFILYDLIFVFFFNFS